MKRILTCAQMKNCDTKTMEEKGMLSAVLMERAALAVVEEMCRHLSPDERILAVCGSGNNGGDGIAIARLLYLRGYSVSIYLSQSPSKFSKETQRQKMIADNYDVPQVNNPDFSEYTTIVDAIFGIGLKGCVREESDRIIRAINASKAVIWSVDIPSGINGDTGEILGQAVKASHTVTFACGKPGLYLGDGAVYSGQVICRDIGIHETLPADTGLWVLEDSDLGQLPDRDLRGNKGTFGKVLVVAGSRNMAGAAYLSARGALLSGAGMVKIHTEEVNRTILQQLIPEALLYTDHDLLSPQQWEDNYRWADTVVIGPGLGLSDRAVQLVEFYLKRCCKENKILILDADALNVLSKRQDLWEYCGNSTVLTPHLGELSRLTKTEIAMIKKDIPGFMGKFQQKHGVTCVAKDFRTVISLYDGRQFLNMSGNSGMATAGSGDVLSGILGGLTAQGIAVATAVPLGVYLHGMAGDRAAAIKGERSMTATDILAGLIEVLKNSEDECNG